MAAVPTAFINSYVNDIKTVVNSIAAANPNVHQVFVNNGDPASAPYFVQNATAAGISSAGLQIVSGVMPKKMPWPMLIAGEQRRRQSTVSPPATPWLRLPFTLAGHTFTSAFAPDGHHPAPLCKGCWPMRSTRASMRLRSSLPILSDQQIVQNVGFTPTGARRTTTCAVCLVPVPGDATGDGIVNGQESRWWRAIG